MEHNGKGIARSLNKQKLYIPRDLAESYDGDVLSFRISEDVKSRFMKDTSPLPSSSQTSTLQRTTTIPNTITFPFS